MDHVNIYFIFTDTGTNLSKIIKHCTKESLNHVSLAFDSDLTEVYSFGRRYPKNPFSGGFVREDIRSEFLRDSNCAIYSFQISKKECESILTNIKEIEAKQNDYRYNFLGLIGVLFRIKIKRKRAFFCSEFVATMLRNAHSIKLSKPNYFITPSDIRTQLGMKLIYQGKLGNYKREFTIRENKIIGIRENSKHSFIIHFSKKVKQFMTR